jgi:hypothetical protein
MSLAAANFALIVMAARQLPNANCQLAMGR